MKKLFFIAALAMLAVGGATAQIYEAGGDNLITCDEMGLTCQLVYGPVGYTVPFNPDDPCAPQQNQDTEVDITDLEFTP